MSTNTCNGSSVKPDSFLVYLLKLGFKLVPLTENHEPAIKWNPICENPDYWTIDRLIASEKNGLFVNVATTFGKTQLISQEGNSLHLNALDKDSSISDLLEIPIKELPISWQLKSKIERLLKDLSEYSSDLSLFDILKKHTFVTKTKKDHGAHAYWLSHIQNKSLDFQDKNNGCRYEIKTDNTKGLCTLPYSTHRKDPYFRYEPIGRTDKILICDILYEILVELFDECIIKRNDDGKKINSNKESIENQSKNTNSITFHNLTPETIKNSIDLLHPYCVDGNRHNFSIPFSGMAFHCKISEESATAIMEGICEKIRDDEKDDRVNTLRLTYKKGIEGKRVTGGPTLVDLIANTKNCDISITNNIVDALKKLWYDEIYNKKQNDEKTPTEISISQAKREKSGYIKVKGTVIGLSPVYHLIKSVTLDCSVCDYHSNIIYPIPKFKSPYKEHNRCPKAEADHGYGNTAIATFEYLSVVDIELQDLDKFNEIERLTVKLFEKHTHDIAVGEVVAIVGNLHVIRKNDNPKNKLETVLFAESIEFVKRQELKLTEKDIQQIQEWKQLQENQRKILLIHLFQCLHPS